MGLNVTGLDIEITLACNLSCSYCYAGVKDRPKGVMSDETILDTIALIKKYGITSYGPRASNGGKKTSPTHIRFYGGEPMLKFEKIQFFVNAAKEAGLDLSYTIMTNGTMCTPEQFAWIKENKISMQRSIDGCGAAQALLRPNSMEKYDEVTKIVQDYGSSRRMTVMPETAHLLMDSVREFEAKGFTGGVSMMPNFYVEWTKEKSDILIRQMWEAADYFIERFKQGKAWYFFYFAKEAGARFGTLDTQYTCGAGKGLHCITWDGHITLCHRFANEPKDGEFCYGTVRDALDGTARDYGKIVHTRMQEVREKKWLDKCKTCIAQYGCEKGCHHACWKCTGDMAQPPELYCRMRVESAKMVAYIDNKLRSIDPNWWVWDNPRVEAQTYKKKHNLKKGESNGRRDTSSPNITSSGKRRYFLQGYITESEGSFVYEGNGSAENRQPQHTKSSMGPSNGSDRPTGEMRFCDVPTVMNMQREDKKG